MLGDTIITNPSDELYGLQKKYNVKISRSDSSDSIYIFRNRSGFRIRIGHPINKNQRHIRNFAVNIVNNKPGKDLVESVIVRYLNRF